MNHEQPKNQELSLSEAEKQQLIVELGSKLHDEWRDPRKKEDGTYEPRVKVLAKTEEGKEKWYDEAKVPANAQELKRQDIANTAFKDLESHWQFENKAAADVAMGEVFKAAEAKIAFDPTFIEKASEVVHLKWLERNNWVYDPNYGNPDLAKPYAELSEAEKEKDRAQVKKGIEIFNSKK